MPARILIAEDFDDNRELLRLMLESAGYSVRETRDGRELVAAARAELPDLVLIDLSMPNLDGWGALTELRADALTRALPCVAVTAFAAEQDRARALAAGFDAYVTKPFRSAELVAAIEKILSTRRDASRQHDTTHASDDEVTPRRREGARTLDHNNPASPNDSAPGQGALHTNNRAR